MPRPEKCEIAITQIDNGYVISYLYAEATDMLTDSTGKSWVKGLTTSNKTIYALDAAGVLEVLKELL